MYEIKAIPVAEGHSVALLLLGAIFPLQFISGVLAYLGRDTPGATAITLLAGSWLGVALVSLGSPAGSTSVTVGLFIIAISAALLIFGLLSIAAR